LQPLRPTIYQTHEKQNMAKNAKVKIAVMNYLSNGSHPGRNFRFIIKLPIHCKCYTWFIKLTLTLSISYITLLASYLVDYHTFLLINFSAIIWQQNKSSRFSVGFWGISWLGFAFIFLRRFELAYICIQVTPQVKKARNQSQNLIGNWFHVTLRIISSNILFK